MDDPWRAVQAGAGAVRVWLPAGAQLEEVGGLEYWSPDPRQGRFTVASDGEDVLGAERAAGGEVTVELDERSARGGVDVRRLRYRVRVQEPRDALEGQRYVGGVTAEHISDMLLLRRGDSVIRAGYTVRADADPELRKTFAEVLDRLRVGSET
jgi:hypothetical protein